MIPEIFRQGDNDYINSSEVLWRLRSVERITIAVIQQDSRQVCLIDLGKRGILKATHQIHDNNKPCLQGREADVMINPWTPNFASSLSVVTL